jgi:hypothetical protein
MTKSSRVNILAVMAGLDPAIHEAAPRVRISRRRHETARDPFQAAPRNRRIALRLSSHGGNDV